MSTPWVGDLEAKLRHPTGLVETLTGQFVNLSDISVSKNWLFGPTGVSIHSLVSSTIDNEAEPRLKPYIANETNTPPPFPPSPFPSPAPQRSDHVASVQSNGLLTITTFSPMGSPLHLVCYSIRDAKRVLGKYSTLEA